VVYHRTLSLMCSPCPSPSPAPAPDAQSQAKVAQEMCELRGVPFLATTLMLLFMNDMWTQQLILYSPGFVNL